MPAATTAEATGNPFDAGWRVLRALRSALTVALYTALAPSGILPYAIATWWWRHDAERLGRALQWANLTGFRLALWWLRWFRVVHFDPSRTHLDLPDQPCVVIANHPTQLDPIAVMTSIGGGCTLVKPSVFRRRLLRPFLARALHFEGPSLDPASLEPVLANAAARLRAGHHLFVFPEGTRSPEHQLRAFSRLPFEIACRTGAPLVSLALRCDPYYLTRETPLYRPPARLPRLTVAVLAVDLPSAVDDDSRALKERVDARYRAWVAAGMPPVPAPAPGPAPSASSSRSPSGA